MTREIFISVAPAETRAALVEDGVVTDLSIDRRDDASVVGNLYLGRIARIMHGTGAAFVDIGLARDGFLSLDDGDGRDAAIHEGAAVLVQAIKDAKGRKGAELSLRPSLAGRWLVYLPGNDRVAISRRITDDDERERLAALGEGIAGPGEGMIVRTAAAGVAAADLEDDFRRLRADWEAIERAWRAARPPVRLHGGPDPVLRILRDWALDGVDRLTVDDDGAARAAERYCGEFVPDLPVERYRAPEDMFESAGIAAEIEGACRRRVRLPSGGNLVIESTEALTAIDVNSGAYEAGRDVARTAFETNLEAAAEALRQIRLRNLSGVIVIDFISMESGAYWAEVIAALKRRAAQDRTFTRVLGRTQTQLVELVRQRRHRPLAELMADSCAACGGAGSTMSVEAACLGILRVLDRTQLPPGRVVVHAAPGVAAALSERYRDVIRDIGVRAALEIGIRPGDDYANDRFEIAPERSAEEAG